LRLSTATPFACFCLSRKAKRDGRKAAVLDLFRGQGPAGDTTGNSPGSNWAAANAIAEFSDFGRRNTKRTDLMQRCFEDAQLKQRGLELVISPYGFQARTASEPVCRRAP
jgi:hypothetical protein